MDYWTSPIYVMLIMLLPFLEWSFTILFILSNVLNAYASPQWHIILYASASHKDALARSVEIMFGGFIIQKLS